MLARIAECARDFLNPFHAQVPRQFLCLRKQMSLSYAIYRFLKAFSSIKDYSLGIRFKEQKKLLTLLSIRSIFRAVVNTSMYLLLFLLHQQFIFD